MLVRDARACPCRAYVTHTYIYAHASLVMTLLARYWKEKPKEKGISITKLYIYPKEKRKENPLLLLNVKCLSYPHTQKEDRKNCSPLDWQKYDA